MEFTRRVELDSKVFQFRAVLNVDVGEVIVLALKQCQIPGGWMEDCDSDVEISVCVKLELRFSVYPGVTKHQWIQGKILHISKSRK